MRRATAQQDTAARRVRYVTGPSRPKGVREILRRSAALTLNCRSRNSWRKLVPPQRSLIRAAIGRRVTASQPELFELVTSHSRPRAEIADAEPCAVDAVAARRQTRPQRDRVLPPIEQLRTGSRLKNEIGNLVEGHVRRAAHGCFFIAWCRPWTSVRRSSRPILEKSETRLAPTRPQPKSHSGSRALPERTFRSSSA
jgi:hypothetical protein